MATATTTTTAAATQPAQEGNTLPFPTEEDVDERLEMINQLKYFLATAPSEWNVPSDEPPIKKHLLPIGDYISCVQWNNSYFISGTDIVRSLVFRFHAFGRPIQNLKKFEEGIFSDLRNLKPGADATLEEPKSSFLDLLYKHNCIRTQKKQKVFNWFSVPHDRLFLDALERDLKREKLGVEPTSIAVANPAVSISLDTTQAMFDEFRKNLLSDLELDACLNGAATTAADRRSYYQHQPTPSSSTPIMAATDDLPRPLSSSYSAPLLSAWQQQQQQQPTESMDIDTRPLPKENSAIRKASSVFGHFSLFEGAPTYKQRRRRTVCHQQQASSQQPNGLRPSPSSSTSSVHMTTCGSDHQQDGSSVRYYSNRDQQQHDDTARLYTCPLNSCGKLFKRLEHLKRHLRTHTMERPYLCGLCGKRFSRSDNLAQHKKTHERRQRPFTASSKGDNGGDNNSNNNSGNGGAGGNNNHNATSSSSSSTKHHHHHHHHATSATATAGGSYHGNYGSNSYYGNNSNHHHLDSIKTTTSTVWSRPWGDAFLSNSGYSSTSSSCYSSPVKSSAPSLAYHHNNATAAADDDDFKWLEDNHHHHHHHHAGGPAPVASLSSSTTASSDDAMPVTATVATQIPPMLLSGNQPLDWVKSDWEQQQQQQQQHHHSPIHNNNKPWYHNNTGNSMMPESTTPANNNNSNGSSGGGNNFDYMAYVHPAHVSPNDVYFDDFSTPFDYSSSSSGYASDSTTMRPTDALIHY